jgi:DNA polymerase-3 subunit alpha
MNVLDGAIERAQAFQKERQGGQKTLFDLLGKKAPKSSKSTLSVQLPECPPWDEKTLLRYEKEALGFYVSSNPMNLYKDRLIRICSGTSRDVETMPDGTEVVLAGILSLEKEVTTRKGDKMGFLQLEDKEGVVEVVAFPETYAVVRDRLHDEDEPVVVIGTVQNQAGVFDYEDSGSGEDTQQQTGWGRRTGVKVIVKEILDIDEAERRSIEKLILHLKADRLKKDDLFRLRNLIADNKGDCPVFLKLRNVKGNDEVMVRLGDEYKINPSNALMEDLRKFFGGNSLEIIYG